MWIRRPFSLFSGSDLLCFWVAKQVAKIDTRHMEIHGYHDVHGFLCIPMDICGYPGISADFNGYPWTVMDIMENVWAAGGRQAAGPFPPDPASMIDNSERRFLHVAIYKSSRHLEPGKNWVFMHNCFLLTPYRN